MNAYAYIRMYTKIRAYINHKLNQFCVIIYVAIVTSSKKFQIGALLYEVLTFLVKLWIFLTKIINFQAI